MIRNQRAFFGVQFRLNQAGNVTGLQFLDQEFTKTKDAPAFDVLIRGGTVYDGSGEKPQIADVAIRGDKVVAVGNLSEATAKTVVDARGLAVSPGFINMLSWSTESLLADGLSHERARV